MYLHIYKIGGCLPWLSPTTTTAPFCARFCPLCFALPIALPLPLPRSTLISAQLLFSSGARARRSRDQRQSVIQSSCGRHRARLGRTRRLRCDVKRLFLQYCHSDLDIRTYNKVYLTKFVRGAAQYVLSEGRTDTARPTCARRITSVWCRIKRRKGGRAMFVRDAE